MIGAIYSLVLIFVAKVADNMLSTAKTLFLQRGRCLLAGLSITLSNFVAYMITVAIVNSNGYVVMAIASIASGVGCCLAIGINDRLSKDRLFINIFMSDKKEQIVDLHNYLTKHHIRHMVLETYSKDLQKKTLTIQAYAETKDESKLIDKYMHECETKFIHFTNPV